MRTLHIEEAPPRRDLLIPAAVTAYVVVFAAWVIGGWGGEAARMPVADLAFLPIGVAGVALAIRAARRDAPLRRAWLLIAAALAFTLTGDALWAALELIAHRSPFPSVADPFYLGFYPLMMAGLLLVPVAERQPGDGLKIGLDALTMLIGGGTLLWHFVMRPLVGEGSGTSAALALAYPAGDLVLLFGVASVMFRRPDPAARSTLRCLAAGCALFVAADAAYGALSLRGDYRAGDWPDAIWMAAQGMFAVAATLPSSAHRRDVHDAGDAVQTPRAFSMLPYASIVVAYALLFVVARPDASNPTGFLLIAAAALTALVVVRQVIVIIENERLTRSLQRLVRTDELTGLFTRRAFMDLAQREWARAKRYQRPLAVLAIDVDNFKAVNDGYGHRTGDEVLAAVARRCRLSLRVTDVLGRVGGDEFVAVLSDTPPDDAYALIERLRGLMSLPVETPNGPITVTVSIGVAGAGGFANLQAMLDRADEAMYAAKQDGRNCVREAVAAGQEPATVISPIRSVGEPVLPKKRRSLPTSVMAPKI